MLLSSRKPPPARFDVLVIGAGHNGLTCACYLARAGLRVGIFERRAIVGGAAVTEEFHPGFRNSTASYTVSLLNPKVIGDLNLAQHGLTILERPMQNFLPLANGDSFSAGPTLAHTIAEAGRFSRRDAERLPDYYAMIERAARWLRELVLRTPPADLKLRELWGLFALGRELRALPLTAQRELHELFTRSAGEILDAWFEGDALKALLGFDSIVGSYASPYTPGSGYVLLHHAFGAVNGKSGVWGHARGGMGAITQAMAREAARLGVHIECEAPVRRVLTAHDAGNGRRTTGIELADGRIFEARQVAANVGPRLLFLDMLAADDLPADFRTHIERWRVGSATLRMNVALAELPRFTARPTAGGNDHLASGIILAGSLGALDRAHAEARLHGMSRAPIVEMLVPSVVDDSLAPPGAHVASLFCQHFDYTLRDGASWDDPLQRAAAIDLVLDTVERHAPNFRASLLGHSALTPLDLERVLGLSGGDIFHGALGLDQIWAARPALGFGDYRTPVRGLFLCGSGAHPGGGVSGLPGHNAARSMLAGRA